MDQTVVEAEQINVVYGMSSQAQFPGKVWDGSSVSRPNPTTEERGPDFKDWSQITAEVQAAQLRTREFNFGIYTNVTSVKAGNCVYDAGSGNVDLAQANSIATATVIGLTQEQAVQNEDVCYANQGVISRLSWSSLTGAADLTPETIYYLSATDAGMFTEIPPTGAGEYIVEIGLAIDARRLLIRIKAPVEVI